MVEKIVHLTLFLVALFATTGTVYAAGSGGGSDTTYSKGRGLSLEQQSAKAFRAGIKLRDRALNMEAKANAAKTPQKRDKLNNRAQKLFSKAVAKQGEAVQLDPQNYKAANELGCALRKTGDYRKAIGAYNYALDINPNFHQATEYRAEAFLALGLYEQTQQAYLRLFRESRELADQLMQSFDAWVDNQPAELSPAEAAFAAWIADRKRIAKITADLSRNTSRGW